MECAIISAGISANKTFGPSNHADNTRTACGRNRILAMPVKLPKTLASSGKITLMLTQNNARYNVITNPDQCREIKRKRCNLTIPDNSN
jgi:hypothetical protein